MTTEDRLKSIIKNYSETDLSEITPETELLSDKLGINSIAIFELIGEVEDEFGVEISDFCLSRLKTVGELIELLNESTTDR